MRLSMKRVLLLPLLFLCHSAYSQTPRLPPDRIRTDIEDFATWAAKLGSCASSFPENKDPSRLHEYSNLISGEIVADMRQQIGNETTDLDSPALANNPEMKAYSDAIPEMIKKKGDEVQASLPQATSAWCSSVQKEFNEYYVSFKKRVEPVAQKEREIERKQQETTQAATDQMTEGAGKDGKSDVAKMQVAFHQSPELLQDARNMNRLLCNAATNGDVDGLRFLLAQGAKDDPDGCIAVYATIDAGRFENISFLLDKSTIEPAEIAARIIFIPSEMREPQRNTLVEQLIHSGLSPNAKRGDEPLLFYAMSYSSPLIVRTLLKLGADPNAIYDNDSAIDYDLNAVDGRDFEAFFATGKIDVNRPEPDGSFLLQGAVVSGKLEVIQTLLHAGADPNVLNRCGRPVLTLAGKPEIVQALLAAKADPTWTDAAGNTLLAHLFNVPDTDAAKSSRLLVAAGLNVNAKNHNGSTILNYSNEFKNPSWILDRSILLSLGATAGAPDDRLTLVNKEGIAMDDFHYRIQPDGGNAIEGVTEASGKTSWVPGEKKYTVTDVYDKRCWLAGNQYLPETCVADSHQKGQMRCSEYR